MKIEYRIEKEVDNMIEDRMKRVKRLLWFLVILFFLLIIATGCAPTSSQLLTSEGYPIPPHQELVISPAGELKVIGYLASYSANKPEFGPPRYLKLNEFQELPAETTHVFLCLWIKNDSNNQKYQVMTESEVYHQNIGWFSHQELLYQDREKKEVLIIKPARNLQYLHVVGPTISGLKLKFRVIFTDETGYPVIQFGDAIYKIEKKKVSRSITEKE